MTENLDPKYKKNYRHQNLQGVSFKEQNLTNSDFSYADIRGADFSNAELKNAIFNYAQAGLQEHWIIFWLIAPLLMLLLLAQVYLSLLFNSMSILGTTLINISSFKVIHILSTTPFIHFLFIVFSQFILKTLNSLNIENEIKNYAPNLIDTIYYLPNISVIGVLIFFFLFIFFKGLNFALRRDTLLFVLLIGITSTVSLSGALFGNIKITAIVTIFEVLFSILAILMVLALSAVGIANLAVHGFVNPNIFASRNRFTVILVSLFVSIFHTTFDGVLSFTLLPFRIILILIAIVTFAIPSKEVLSDYYRQHIKQHIKSSIISIVFIYSISIIIYLYFLAINTFGFLFITIIGIQIFLVGYVIFYTLEGDEKFSLLKRFTIDIIAATGTSFRNANLINASFYEGELKNSDFGGAILINTNFNKAKNFLLARIYQKRP